MTRRLSLCTIMSLVAVGTAAGQVDIKACAQNSWYVAGLLSMSYTQSEYAGYSSYRSGSFAASLAPRVLFFSVDGIGVGGEGYFGYDSQDGESFPRTTGFSLGVGPRVAIYLRSPQRRYAPACCFTPYVGPNGWWMPYAGLSIVYLTSTYREEYGREEYRRTGDGWRFKIGVGVSPVVGTKGTIPVELGFKTESITYVYERTESRTYKYNTLYLEAGFGAFLWK
jgi:hypothetical protein